MRRIPPFLVLAFSLTLLSSPGGAKAQGAKKKPPVKPAPKAEAKADADDAAAEALKQDEQTLTEAKVGTGGDNLVQFFRKRTMLDADKKKMQKFIRDLGDDDFQVRQRATRALIELGSRSITYLREAEKEQRAKEEKDKDFEVFEMIGFCVLTRQLNLPKISDPPVKPTENLQTRQLNLPKISRPAS